MYGIVFVFFNPDVRKRSFCLLFILREFCGALPHAPVRKIFEKIFPTPFKNFYFFVLVVVYGVLVHAWAMHISILLNKKMKNIHFIKIKSCRIIIKRTEKSSQNKKAGDNEKNEKTSYTCYTDISRINMLPANEVINVGHRSRI
jgi:hypothetical protein